MYDIDMDDNESLLQYDRSGIMEVLGAFPSQVSEALDIGYSDLELPSAEGLKNVVVLGMGGSGISGDVVAVLAAGCGFDMPVVTVKGYDLPPFAGDETLVFAVSYSGNTEETVSTFEQAKSRGSRLVAVCSGGRLKDLALDAGVPVFAIPGGLQPRASLGYLFIPVVCAMERMGLLQGVVEQLRGSVPILELRSGEFGPDSPFDANPTKRLAKELIGFLPVVYGSEGYLAVAAMRWKAQLNEMAKVPAFCNWFPELNHNETVGWKNLVDVCSRSHLVVLREPGENARIKKRIDITLDLLEESVGPITQVCARGSNDTQRLLDSIYFGDYTSVYLALALEQDPTPVDRIEELKKRLSQA